MIGTTCLVNICGEVQSGKAANGSHWGRFNAASNDWRRGKVQTTFLKVVLWDQRDIEFAKKLKMGSSITFTGESYLEKYTGKDGVERTDLVVEARGLKYGFQGKKENGGAPKNESSQRQAPQDDVEEDEDLDSEDEVPF